MRTFIVVATLLCASPALAAVSILGPGPAQDCFEAARDGDTSLTSLRACDAALSGQDLASRDRAATHTNRGVLHLQRREASEALVDFDLAIALQPGLGEPHVNRGAALILLNRHAEAVASINQGLALGTQDPHEAHFNRAIAFEELGDLPAAYRDFREAARLAPEWPAPQTELARFTVAERTP